MPRRTSSAARSACRSENASTRSGFSDSILSNFALMNAETFGLSRASGGRTVYPETPTMRSPWPRRYSVSVVSSVRQTIRLGYRVIWSPEGLGMKRPGEPARGVHDARAWHAELVADERGNVVIPDGGNRSERVPDLQLLRDVRMSEAVAVPQLDDHVRPAGDQHFR